jgi:hypothetical protein
LIIKRKHRPIVALLVAAQEIEIMGTVSIRTGNLLALAPARNHVLEVRENELGTFTPWFCKGSEN